jgi:hypothetical protein
MRFDPAKGGSQIEGKGDPMSGLFVFQGHRGASGERKESVGGDDEYQIERGKHCQISMWVEIQ